MAASVDSDTATDKAKEVSPEQEDDVMATCKANIEAARKTLASFESLERRWKTAFGVEATCSLTAEERKAVLGGKPDINVLCEKLTKGQFKQVIVMTGAGISVSAGIPDFRSEGTGFYEKLDIAKYGLPSPQSVFDLDYFRKYQKPFFSVAKELYPGKYHPTPSHYFVKLLANKGYLLRYYTQNIDGLERVAGIKDNYLVEAHGSFSTAKCIDCAKEHGADKVKSAIFADEIPTCDACGSGVVKPNIVFFGEDLPARFKDLLEPDFSNCDLLIVMGTSLKVQPFAGLVHRVKQTTPRLLINQERVGTFVLSSEGGYRDVAMIQDCDSAVNKICELCGWTEELKKLISQQGAQKTKTVGREQSRTQREAHKTKHAYVAKKK